MSADVLLQVLTQGLYVTVFLVVGTQYLIRPRHVLLGQQIRSISRRLLVEYGG